MVDLQTLVAVGGGIAALLGGAVTIGVTVGRPLRKLSRQNDEFREDWYGTPARAGRDAVPGVPERLARIEHELRPRGGGTLSEALSRVETRIEDHIRSHPGGTS